MKKVLSLFTTLAILCSCGSDLEVPATYEFSTSTLLSWETYRYDADGNYAQVDNSEAPEPDISNIQSSGRQKTITLEEGGTTTVDDYGDIYSSTYEGSNPITIAIDSQPTDFESINDGASISARAILSGNFNPNALDNNVLVSSMCGDFVNCQEIDANEWLFTFGAAEGEVLYIVVVEETYTRQ